MNLRPYQSTDVDALRGLFRSHQRVCYQLSTGGGKTHVFGAITTSAAARGKRVWVLVHRRELLRQASQKLTLSGVDHGVVAAGVTPAYTKPVQVMSVQTAIRRLAKLDHVDLIIADEAHHAVAKTWQTLIAARPSAKLLGVTATPTRTTGGGLGDLFTALHCGPAMAWLIDRGFLAPYRAFGPPPVATMDGVHTRMGDYVASEVAERMDTPKVIGDAVSHYRRFAHARRAMAFCASVKHAEDQAAAFRQAGYRFESVDGTMETGLRDRRLAGLADGTLDGLTSCDLVSEGVDVPAATVAILLRPTQSLIVYLQQVGRVLRPETGKTALILDHVGNMARHGMPDDPREWSLDPATKRRAPTASIRTCARCYAVFRPGVAKCPECGFSAVSAPRAPVETVDGELQEITAAQRLAMRKEIGQARTREALEAIAAQRGYSKGWVYHTLKARGQRT